MALPTFDPPEWAPAQPFWDGLGAGELRLPRCSRCAAFRWYPDDAGPHCVGPHGEGAETVWETLPGTGTVYTHTTVRRPFPPSTEPESLPLVVVLVEPDGAPGVRVVGNLIEAEPQIGLRVALRVVDRDDRRHPVFAPVTDPTGGGR